MVDAPLNMLNTLFPDKLQSDEFVEGTYQNHAAPIGALEKKDAALTESVMIRDTALSKDLKVGPSGQGGSSQQYLIDEEIESVAKHSHSGLWTARRIAWILVIREIREGYKTTKDPERPCKGKALAASVRSSYCSCSAKVSITGSSSMAGLAPVRG